jgi:hypothetical protein
VLTLSVVISFSHCIPFLPENGRTIGAGCIWVWPYGTCSLPHLIQSLFFFARIATDLNLHHPNTAKPLNEQHAREMLNRTRVWLNCFNLDRSTGSQYGKSPIIRNTDYIANHSEDWWKSSEYNMQHFDIHICAYNNELRVMANFLARIYSDPKHPTGLNKVCYQVLVLMIAQLLIFITGCRL